MREEREIYLVIDYKGATAAEATDGGHSIFHVGTDQVDVIYLYGDDQGRNNLILLLLYIY